MKPVYAAAVAALVSLCLIDPAPAIAGTLHDRTLPASGDPESRERRFKVYVPDGLPSGGSAPLVTVLHGCRQAPLPLPAASLRASREISIDRASPPRVRSLEAFGRRPRAKRHPDDRPASETLHIIGQGRHRADPGLLPRNAVEFGEPTS